LGKKLESFLSFKNIFGCLVKYIKGLSKFFKTSWTFYDFWSSPRT